MGWLAMTGWFCAAAAAFRRCRFLRMKKMPTATKASKAGWWSAWELECQVRSRLRL